MFTYLNHASLESTLRGVDLPTITQYRGIPYGRILRRFSPCEQIKKLPKELDCTRFGPRCPQLPVDVGHLLRIPPSISLPLEPEDEFQCTNLDVFVPKTTVPAHASRLPVLVWIHGGSQAITFGSTASGVCDMTPLIADSVNINKPIIAVSVQYRLNVFALGDGTGPTNLALRDQASALEWVQHHIAGFGGDPNRVTLAGESAGAVYCHAHLVTNAPAQQYILASGSLYLSPPQPTQNVSALRNAVSIKLQELYPDFDLSTASASQIVEAIKQSGIQSFFLQQEQRFEGWETSLGKAHRLLLSDVQKESAIWQAGIWSAGVKDIVTAFESGSIESRELKELYHIHPERPSSCKFGALDFINDYKFGLPLFRMAKLWKTSNKPVFRYLVDEANPWQPSSGAHHAVDLLLLFGGFDMGVSPTAQRTGQEMRVAWIQFLNFEQPWTPPSCDYAFGPYGASQTIDHYELASRRRIAQIELLDKTDPALLNKVFAGLAAGRISLLN
ncbi:Alpha/Beta hydrolase protein [Xylariales sp. AK1849]|nr:Alpha/Beta hydrolase protein [Xylariales sp. AK1849]